MVFKGFRMLHRADDTVCLPTLVPRHCDDSDGPSPLDLVRMSKVKIMTDT